MLLWHTLHGETHSGILTSQVPSHITACSWLISHRDLLERYQECKSAQQVKQVQDAILSELEEDAARRKESLMAYGEDLLVPNPNHFVLQDD